MQERRTRRMERTCNTLRFVAPGDKAREPRTRTENRDRTLRRDVEMHEVVIAALVEPQAVIIAALQDLRAVGAWTGRTIFGHLSDVGLGHDGDDLASLHLSALKELRPPFVLGRLTARWRRRFTLGDTQLIRAGRQRLAVRLHRFGDPDGTERRHRRTGGNCGTLIHVAAIAASSASRCRCRWICRRVLRRGWRPATLTSGTSGSGCAGRRRRLLRRGAGR